MDASSSHPLASLPDGSASSRCRRSPWSPGPASVHLRPHSNQLVVDAGQLIDLHVHAIELALIVLDGSGGLGVVGGHLLVGDLDLCELLDGVLHLGVTIVGAIQGHLQLGDRDVLSVEHLHLAAVVGRGGHLVQLLVAGLPWSRWSRSPPPAPAVSC